MNLEVRSFEDYFDIVVIVIEFIELNPYLYIIRKKISNICLSHKQQVSRGYFYKGDTKDVPLLLMRRLIMI